jgi:transposase
MEQKVADGFFMSHSQKFETDIIGKVAAGQMTVKLAAKALDVSERSIFRYLKSWQAEGVSYVVHGNKFRSPKNRTSAELKLMAKKIMVEKYFDFNITHTLEKLRENEGLKGLNRESFRKWVHEWKMVKHKVRGCSKARYMRGRHKQRGMLLQLDGSYHEWYGVEKSCLIAVIDDATSEIVEMEFFDWETTEDCMAILQIIIERFGIFEILYTDKAGVFGGGKRVHFSQLKQAVEAIGSHFIYANSPEAKGRIERLFKTLQDRLVAELRLHNITERAAANKFVKTYYIKNHNAKFGVAPVVSENAYRPVPPQVDLKEIFCLKYFRVLQKDHTLNFESKTYLIKSPLRYSIKKSNVEVRVYPNKQIKFYYGGIRLDATSLTSRYNFDEINAIKEKWKKIA